MVRPSYVVYFSIYDLSYFLVRSFNPWFSDEFVNIFSEHNFGSGKSSNSIIKEKYDVEKNILSEDLLSAATTVKSVKSYHKLITLPPRPAGRYYLNSRWGPYFEEGAEPTNLTTRVGETVLLNCKIGLLHDKTVSLNINNFWS